MGSSVQLADLSVALIHFRCYTYKAYLLGFILHFVDSISVTNTLAVYNS